MAFIDIFFYALYCMASQKERIPVFTASYSTAMFFVTCDLFVPMAH